MALGTHDNMTKTVEELTARGVTIIAGPPEIENEETWAYFIDPDGNVLEYIQWYRYFSSTRLNRIAKDRASLALVKWLV